MVWRGVGGGSKDRLREAMEDLEGMVMRVSSMDGVGVFFFIAWGSIGEDADGE